MSEPQDWAWAEAMKLMRAIHIGATPERSGAIVDHAELAAALRAAHASGRGAGLEEAAAMAVEAPTTQVRNSYRDSAHGAREAQMRIRALAGAPPREET